MNNLENDQNSSLSLRTSSILELLVNQFNNATPENSNDHEKVCSSKYYDIEEMHNIEILDKNNLLSLFHINARCLNKYFDDLQHLLSFNHHPPSLPPQKKIDRRAISETRITKQVPVSSDLNLKWLAWLN